MKQARDDLVISIKIKICTYMYINCPLIFCSMCSLMSPVSFNLARPKYCDLEFDNPLLNFEEVYFFTSSLQEFKAVLHTSCFSWSFAITKVVFGTKCSSLSGQRCIPFFFFFRNFLSLFSPAISASKSTFQDI